MIKSNILLIDVVFKLQLREFWKVILSQSIWKSGILVINVNIKLVQRGLSKDIRSLCIRNQKYHILFFYELIFGIKVLFLDSDIRVTS